jgi:hypothetical protein
MKATHHCKFAYPILLLALLSLASVGCTASEEGAPCPCGDGWECCEGTCQQGSCTTAKGLALCPDGLLTEIEANHSDPVGHQIDIPVGDVTSTTAKSYDMQGDSSHTHTLYISDYHFEELRTYGKQSLFTTPLNDDPNEHAHIVNIYCHDNPPPDGPPAPDAGLP